MKKNPRYQLKHLSIRVPWHDNKWNGTVCNSPKKNGACLILKNCALERDDELEEKNSGLSIENLNENEFPTCVKESGTFMAPFPYYRTLIHPYEKSSPTTHGHLKQTNVRFPQYSGSAIPYRWMRKENAVLLDEEFDLGFNHDMEPVLDWNKKVLEKGWIQEAKNQKSLLNCFFQHLEEKLSLVFFYAKQVPFVEDNGRVLVGVGRINTIQPSELYEGSNKKFKAAYWEHMVNHSIRPDLKDGVLLPYHQAIKYGEINKDFDPSELAVFSPKDKTLEFSYGSELVSNDSAIRVLLDFSKSLQRAKELGIGDGNNTMIQWIHDRIHELQKLRGDYPGMGAALCSLGFKRGHFIAAEIINTIKENENPWLKFEEALENPSNVLSDNIASELTGMAIKAYKRYKKRPDKTRLNFLYLLSRFDINQDQADILWSLDKREQLSNKFDEKDYINNPYLLFISTIRTEFPIDFYTIDLGLYNPEKGIEVYPNVHLVDPLDEKRLMALSMYSLEKAALNGHTLLPRSFIINQINSLNLSPKVSANSDHLEITEDIFQGHIHLIDMKDEKVAYQLDRLNHASTIIRNKVQKSLKADRIIVNTNWSSLLNEELKAFTIGEPDEMELKAREEKAAALKEISQSRFSVLIGPAGTGKTTLLRALVSDEDIRKNGVLFLAPTGKARVRMQELSVGTGIKVSTVAQFLNGYDRFDGKLQQYILSHKYCEGVYQTVVLDESSMMTEEMLASLIDTFKGMKRFIMVGDHRQLPPIGPGRPFMDIIKYLEPDEINKQFPKIGKGYAELTIKRRQGGENREDLQLAEWFSGNPLAAGEDKIINEILNGIESDYISMYNWNSEEEFENCFEKVLKEEFGIVDSETFNRSVGSHNGKLFNSTGDSNYFKTEPAINGIEDWQVLSPVREKPHGVRAINRKLHKIYRQKRVDYLNNYKKYPKLPKPLGAEEITYGDKVINLSNHKRKNCYPKDGLNYIANGEIGLLVGQWKKGYHTYKGQPKNTEVEFSSQKGYVYTFKKGDFKEENNGSLELAYAITVHKSQGSQFNKVILVIPNPCFLLTREMLYTALTRQVEKVIILYQGDSFEIKELSSSIHSDTLKRITNLFEAPELIELDGKYLEKSLIHQASDGLLLRSKSELLIYQQLINNNLEPIYEKELIIKEVRKLPDFTIMDEYSDRVYYWEHCGMMHVKEYRERWKEKQLWYRENGILPIEEGGGENGTLIATYDTVVEIDGIKKGAFSVKDVDEYISLIKA